MVVSSNLNVILKMNSKVIKVNHSIKFPPQNFPFLGKLLYDC